MRDAKKGEYRLRGCADSPSLLTVAPSHHYAFAPLPSFAPPASLSPDFPGLIAASAMAARVREVDTLLVSDVHLGSDLSRPPALLSILKQHAFKRLILLGDILDDLNLSRLQRHDWELLRYIRALCAP
ncbi:MAG: hypothetical protein ACREQ3_11795, partial [Candidatus Binatia bacterium]